MASLKEARRVVRWVRKHKDERHTIRVTIRQDAALCDRHALQQGRTRHRMEGSHVVLEVFDDNGDHRCRAIWPEDMKQSIESVLAHEAHQPLSNRVTRYDPEWATKHEDIGVACDVAELRAQDDSGSFI